jgi:hypothetical protein
VPENGGWDLIRSFKGLKEEIKTLAPAGIRIPDRPSKFAIPTPSLLSLDEAKYSDFTMFGDRPVVWK